MTPDRLAWPFYAARHRALADRLAEFAGALPEAHATEAEVEAATRAHVVRLAAGGLLDLAVPQPGATHDVRALTLAREALAYQDGLADFAFAMQGLGAGPIVLFGTPEQQARLLPGPRDGSAVCAFALSEPDAGSDVAALALAATRDGPDWRLDGEKTWISNGAIADQMVVFARTGEAPGAKGITAFVVPGGAEGLRVVERISVIAPHPLARLRFDGVRVPDGDRIGDPGAGFKVAMATLDVFRATVAAAALGFGRRAQDAALAHAAGRRIFAGALLDLAQVQAMLADSALELDAAALLIARAAWVKDETGARVTREAAMAKLHATEAAQRVIDRAVQIHGAAGVVAGSVPERLYREIRALRIYEGASEVQRVVIAGQERARLAATAA